MKNNDICHAPYLRNSTTYDHVFWYTCVKWYLQVYFFSFFIFLVFLFFGLFLAVLLSVFLYFSFFVCWGGGGGGGGGGGKKAIIVKMKNNNYICHALHLRNSIAYDHNFWYTCVKWWYLQVFFPLFWNHFKGLKIAQN